MSAYSEFYGWSDLYDINKLTTTNTGLSNIPAGSEWTNLSYLSDWLAELPFSVGVNSGFRTEEVNQAVGGADNSEHKKGLGADLKPPFPWTNKDLATWFYLHRNEYPDLDQVIWYHDTGHTHIGLKMSGAQKEFLEKTSTSYLDWKPTPEDIARIEGKRILGVPIKWAAVGGASLLGLVLIGGIWYYSGD